MDDNPKRFVILVLLAWLCFAVGLAGGFHNESAPVLAATVWTLTALALLACCKIGPIKAWAMQRDLPWLAFFHVTRSFAGDYVLMLCRRGESPCGLATRAGLRDIIAA